MTSNRPEKWIEGVTPDDRTIDVAVRTLQARLAAVTHYLPLAAENSEEDIEYVHELRVWTRRASAALKLYADFFPRRRAARMKKQLKRLRRAANDARDCDVLAQRLAEEHSNPESARGLEEIRTQRAAAQKPIIAIHERYKRDDRFGRRIAKLVRCVRVRGQERHGIKGSRFGRWARSSMRPILEAFFESAPVNGMSLAALHRFRIRGKELRYAMELLAAAFHPEFREQLYPLIEAIQERLGAINDVATAESRFYRRIRKTDDWDEMVRLRRCLVVEQERLEQAQQEFHRWFTPQIQRELRAGFDRVLNDAQAVGRDLSAVDGSLMSAERQGDTAPRVLNATDHRVGK